MYWFLLSAIWALVAQWADQPTELASIAVWVRFWQGLEISAAVNKICVKSVQFN